MFHFHLKDAFEGRSTITRGWCRPIFGRAPFDPTVARYFGWHIIRPIPLQHTFGPTNWNKSSFSSSQVHKEQVSGKHGLRSIGNLQERWMIMSLRVCLSVKINVFYRPLACESLNCANTSPPLKLLTIITLGWDTYCISQRKIRCKANTNLGDHQHRLWIS